MAILQGINRTLASSGKKNIISTPLYRGEASAMAVNSTVNSGPMHLTSVPGSLDDCVALSYSWYWFQPDSVSVWCQESVGTRCRARE